MIKVNPNFIITLNISKTSLFFFLEIHANPDTGSKKVKEWYFNLDPW